MNSTMRGRVSKLLTVDSIVGLATCHKLRRARAEVFSVRMPSQMLQMLHDIGYSLIAASRFDQ